MRRSFLYVAVAVLAIVSAALGYRIYQDRTRQSGVEIRMDENGVSMKAH